MVAYNLKDLNLMVLVLIVMSAPFILLIFAVLGFVIYSYDVKVKILEKELEKHEPLTSNTLRKNVEYQMDFENYINEKELDILFYNFRKLNTEQKDRFLAMYRFIDTIPKEKRSWAYSQIMRTINEG